MICVRVVMAGSQVLVGPRQRLRAFALAQQLVHVAIVVGLGQRAGQQRAKGQQPGAVVQGAQECRRCVGHGMSVFAKAGQKAWRWAIYCFSL